VGGGDAGQGVGGGSSPAVALEIDEGALGEVPQPSGDVIGVRLCIGVETVPRVLLHRHVFLGLDARADRYVPGQGRVLVEQYPGPRCPAQVEGRAAGQGERLRNDEVLAEAVTRNLQLAPTPIAQEPLSFGRCELHSGTATSAIEIKHNIRHKSGHA
jgi:hypothetical protein